MKEQILSVIEKSGITTEQILQSLQDIVEMESYTHDPRSVSILSSYLKKKFESLGFSTREHTFENSGPLLIAEWGQGDISKGIILTGHMDTVFKTGYLKDHPFRIENGRIYGPGVLDMKGGINLMFYIIELLQFMDYKHPIKVILAGDEEHGHEFSNCNRLIQEEGKGYKCAFNMETGLLNNGITVARKGRMECTIKVHGKSAHAGANFNDGIHAIYELAHVLTKVSNLNGKHDEVTFSAGIIRGGDIVNAIPDYAETKIDIRYYGEHLREGIINDLHEIVNNPTIEGAKLEIDLIEGFPSFMDTLNETFFDIVNRTSIEFGFGETTPHKLGGSSDASWLALAGIPCLCSMGVPGEWNHTDREYALVDSLLDRLILIVGSILKLENIDLIKENEMNRNAIA